ncbi:hypothetical protein ACIPTR_20350 [Pectobacterium sp. CHL-2024]|uniref:hypothetical protein n=1 Tax=Pectobacterium TaxID=122277 RepID=UPI0004E6A98E|nr:hypothetical protein [Pectobacterium brasiliense]KFF63442.1 hypothetical protein IV99_18800 [Pectobacterium brasiliense]
MNAKTNIAKPEEKKPQTQQEKKKTCFVIMPIADVPSYDTGHFTRVYHHIIKPACDLANFEAIRADDINSSHMIVVDILKKIVECDIAICDLSSRNPNVLYELGLRQAFNKKTVLIKDNKTENIFDVQGFRYAQYDSNLRVDNVNSQVVKISEALKETINSKSDINSVVQLLQIEPANIESKTKLTEGDTYLLNAINEIKSIIEKNSPKNLEGRETFQYKKSALKLYSQLFKPGDEYYVNGDFLGKYLGYSLDENLVYFEGKDEITFNIPISSKLLQKAIEIPF